MSVDGMFPKFSSSRTIWPIAYPLWELIIVWATWICLWIIIIGYYIRIFRGDTTPPSFAPGGTLIKDGFIAQMAVLVWTIPIIICESIILVSPDLTLLWVLDLLWILLFLVTPPIYFIYANTGVFFSSVRPSKIIGAIRNPGWGYYIAAWVIVALSFLILACISFFLNFILVHILPLRFNPSSNFVIFGFFSPIFGVFIAKLFTNVFLNRKGLDAINTENG